jgi:hypothetical protein
LLASVLAAGLLVIAACGGGGSSPSAASCAGSRGVPSRYIEPGTPSTHIQLVQKGCSVGIASIELYSGSHLVRRVAFSPPLPAGRLDAQDAAQATGKGSFQSTAQISGVGGTVTVKQEGTYQATSGIVVAATSAGPTRQWAVAATASTELNPPKFSAANATGAPSNKAWAPSTKDGTSEWLEVTYSRSVVPTAVDIWESNGPGFVTRIEAFEQAKNRWVKLWEGKDPTAAAPRMFSPRLAKTSLSTQRIRLTVDTRAPDWNEVAAVALRGGPESARRVLWLQGEWIGSGKQTVCAGKTCASSPMKDVPTLSWSFAINTSTGKLGTTPDQVG